MRIPGIHPHGLGKLAVNLQVTLLTMQGKEEPGLDQGVNDFQLFLTGMTGNMEALALFVDHIGALAV